MASTSAPTPNPFYGLIGSVASTLDSDNQTLAGEIRKALLMMKEIAVDFEKDNDSQSVKELEDSVLQLLKASDECTHLSNAMLSMKNDYRPGAELTNFSKLLDEKIERLRNDSSSVSENHLWLRQFHEVIWNVHHAGQPMPGEEQEDLVMTSTQCNLLNVSCPLTGKPVTELADPVRSMDCKHIYEKKAIMHHIKLKSSQGRCPITGCPKKLQADRVVCDTLLLIEIDELRSMSKQHARSVWKLIFSRSHNLTSKKVASIWVYHHPGA